MPPVKLMTKADLIRINARAIELNLASTLPPEICADVEPELLCPVLDPLEIGEDVIRGFVVLTPEGVGGVLDIPAAEYRALPWSRMS